VLDLHDPSLPSLAGRIDVSALGSPNSVAVRKGVVAIAVEASPKTDPGSVAFADAAGNLLGSVRVGALPDMLTFTPDGRTLLVVNEAEPSTDYAVDPEGSVSVIDVRGPIDRLTQDDVRTAGFSAFNGTALDPSVRVYGPGATVAEDLEPEYLAVDSGSRTAWVTLQENNALAELDVRRAEITALHGLGFKDHSLPANAFDASDRDTAVRIAAWPVKGMYQPDGIAVYRTKGDTYLVTANEGDAREWEALTEERRVGALTLDPTAFPDPTLRANANLGRLSVTAVEGDTDGDGDYDELYAFGARSFSIRRTDGTLVFDSGDALERITAAALPAQFNSNNDANNSFDTRSDNKGPEPEDVKLAELKGRWYAFVGLERIGGIVVYDVTSPTAPRFVEYVNNRNFAGSPAAGTAGDLGPEGLVYIARSDSPIDSPLLVVTNEISGTTSIYAVEQP
jgi:DNA-binding beta-propeller fold protein YncE